MCFKARSLEGVAGTAFKTAPSTAFGAERAVQLHLLNSLNDSWALDHSASCLTAQAVDKQLQDGSRRSLLLNAGCF